MTTAPQSPTIPISELIERHKAAVAREREFQALYDAGKTTFIALYTVQNELARVRGELQDARRKAAQS